jgi:hypothetical protein
MLVQLFGGINYGGRLTDDWDRRLVMVTLAGVVNAGLMDDSFPLAPGEGYQSPPPGSVDDYRQVISRLPLQPHPNVFGLHENADISCANFETQTLCDIMISLQPKVSSGGGKSRDEVIEHIIARHGIAQHSASRSHPYALLCYARSSRTWPTGCCSGASRPSRSTRCSRGTHSHTTSR